MKHFEIDGINTILSDESLANVFNVYDESKLGNNYKTYSINRTFNFSNIDVASSALISKYQVQLNDSWTSIAYRLYQQESLWWIICKVNGIVDPMQTPIEGTIINFLKPQYVNSIINMIKQN